MKKILSMLFLLIFINACTAQQAIRRDVLPPPSIRVSNMQKGEVPIAVKDVKIDVRVVGMMAVTTIDMIFYNGNNRILEGELQFPLAEGQNISRFALDINGKLREGVVVEKAKGQEVFESVIRQNIDPGLLEKTQGNNFRARIYPLPAKGTRRIVIAYEEELSKVNDKYTVFLPIDYKQTLSTYSLNLCVYGSEEKPNVDETPWDDLSFDKSGDAYIASFKAENFWAEGQLVFSVPEKKKQQVYIEKGKISGETVFYARTNPKIDNRSKKLPQTIALYWDASMSMSDRKFDLETELLDKYFGKIANLNVDLHVFNCISRPVKTFTVKKGNWDELKKQLEAVRYDGATQLGILNFDNTKAGEILLFSDGLSNFGKLMPTTGKTPVITVSSALKADYSLLQYLASTTGGKYINLMQQTADDAVKMLLGDSYRFISAEYNKSEVAEFTTSNILIKPSTGFSIAGKLKAPTASIKLNFGIGNEILHSRTITIDAKELSDYDNITERIWAEKKIEELDMLYDKNRYAIEELGRKYNIVTRNTSLIVLDRLEDYIQHKIVPPAELLDEYNKVMTTLRDDDAASKNHQINSVVSMFDERKQWWNRVFPKTPVKRKKPAIHNDDDVIISIEDVRGTDDANGIDIAELREQRVVVESEPTPSMAFISPTMMADKQVAQDEMSMELEETPVISDYKPREDVPRKPQTVASIQLAGWNPETPYLKMLKEKSKEELYEFYLDIRDEYKSTPSFFLDVATLFEERGLKQEALIVLSNLAELEVENYRLVRVLAHRLQQLGYTEYAIGQFEIVLRLRPEEPQSYRDLALANAENKRYQEAVDLCYRVIERSWDGRFQGVELIVAEEMNRVIAKAARENVRLLLDGIDKRLIYNMPVDVRIVLNWDTDNSDMDLWVIDPYGEQCYYANKRTRIGGLISNDFTGGYGPEEFLIKQAVNGTYKVQTNYYGSREQTLIGPTTIYLELFTRFADGQEKKETITLRLTEDKEVINIGEITFSNK